MATIRDYIDYVRAQPGPEIGESKLTEDDLAEIEDELGVALPPSYRELVLSCDGEELYGLFYWVGDDVPEDFSILGIREAIDIPPFLIPVIEVGDGDIDCFDTRYPDESGEYPLVRLNHELENRRRKKFEGIAPNLATYLAVFIKPSGNAEGG